MNGLCPRIGENRQAVRKDASEQRDSRRRIPSRNCLEIQLTGINSSTVIPRAASSGSSRAALSHVPSRVNVPTCISYNIRPSIETPGHSWSVQVNSPGSTISDGPCGPFGWKREAGSG